MASMKMTDHIPHVDGYPNFLEVGIGTELLSYFR